MQTADGGTWGVSTRASLVLGIDVGGSSAKVGLFSDRGALLGEGVFPTRSTVDSADAPARSTADPAGSPACSEEPFALLSEGLKVLLAGEGACSDDVAAVGIALPGMVSREGQPFDTPNLEMDAGKFIDAVTETFPASTVWLCNDADAALAGELWRGRARGVDDVVMVVIGTGIGAGVACGGRIIWGRCGAAGEIGHLKVDMTGEGRTCGCGARGCIERYLSGTGFAEVVGMRLEACDEPSALRGAGPLDAREIFDAALSGDGFALEQTDRFADELAFTLTQISCVLAPQLILIGGGVSLSASAYLDGVRTHFRKRALRVLADTPIEAAALRNRAGMYGAALLALKGWDPPIP